MRATCASATFALKRDFGWGFRNSEICASHLTRKRKHSVSRNREWAEVRFPRLGKKKLIELDRVWPVRFWSEARDRESVDPRFSVSVSLPVSASLTKKATLSPGRPRNTCYAQWSNLSKVTRKTSSQSEAAQPRRNRFHRTIASRRVADLCVPRLKIPHRRQLV